MAGAAESEIFWYVLCMWYMELSTKLTAAYWVSVHSTGLLQRERVSVSDWWF